MVGARCVVRMYMAAMFLLSISLRIVHNPDQKLIESTVKGMDSSLGQLQSQARYYLD